MCVLYPTLPYPTYETGALPPQFHQSHVEKKEELVALRKQLAPVLSSFAEFHCALTGHELGSVAL